MIPMPKWAIGFWGLVFTMPASSAEKALWAKDSIPVGGEMRTYHRYQPANWDPATGKIVLALHGAYSNSRGMARRSRLNAQAEKHGWLVLYPNGWTKPLWRKLHLFQTWNAGFCCGNALFGSIDDVVFIDTLLDKIERDIQRENLQVYLCGYSNGGMMVYRYAAQRPHRIAALAVVAGTIGAEPLDGFPRELPEPPHLPIPVLAFHGTDDRSVPYAGGAIRFELPLYSVDQSMLFWATNNHSVTDKLTHTPPFQKEHIYRGSVTRTTWLPGSNHPVVLYALHHWEHDWPGAKQTARWGSQHPLSDFNATKIIGNFFQRH